MANVITINRPDVVALIEEAAKRLTGGNKTEAADITGSVDEKKEEKSREDKPKEEKLKEEAAKPAVAPPSYRPVVPADRASDLQI